MVQRNLKQSLLGDTSNYFWDGAAVKIPHKIKSVGSVSVSLPRYEHNYEFFLSKERIAQ
jgi:hypothetical protein